MPQLPDAETLAMAVSNSMYVQYGFGPSMDLCIPFARRVLAERKRIEELRDE